MVDYIVLCPQQLGGVVRNQLLRREAHLLELLGVRGGDLGAGDTDGGSLQVVKGVLGGQGDNLGADAEAGEAGLDRHHVAGLLDRLDNGLDVERLDGAQVDDLGLDAVLLLQLLGRDQRLAHAPRERDQGDV